MQTQEREMGEKFSLKSTRRRQMCMSILEGTQKGGREGGRASMMPVILAIDDFFGGMRKGMSTISVCTRVPHTDIGIQEWQQ